jgi:hypothetical protein
MIFPEEYVNEVHAYSTEQLEPPSDELGKDGDYAFWSPSNKDLRWYMGGYIFGPKRDGKWPTQGVSTKGETRVTSNDEMQRAALASQGKQFGYNEQAQDPMAHRNALGSFIGGSDWGQAGGGSGNTQQAKKGAPTLADRAERQLESIVQQLIAERDRLDTLIAELQAVLGKVSQG